MIFNYKTMKNTFAAVMSLALIATSASVGQISLRADEETEDVADNTVIAYEYDGTDAVAGEDLTEYADPDDDYTYLSTTGEGTMTASTTGTNLKHMEWGDSADYGFAVPILAAGSKNPWSADAYVAYTFSTETYSGLTASVDVGGTKKGPANLTMGYYDEEGEFRSVCTYTIAKNKTMYTVTFELPEVLENQESITVYVKLADTTNIGGNEMTDDSYSTGGELAINNFIVSYESVIESEDKTTTAEDETTTEQPADDETTTVEPSENETTTAATETTTAVAATTASGEVTAPGKAAVKKVNKKKLSAKKLSLKIKKLSGADGYQVAVYKTKKNAKKNKKAIVIKTVTKRKVTLKSKKLKNKKKLFVRVRAYKLDADGNKVYGKRSKVKKVKVQ